MSKRFRFLEIPQQDQGKRQSSVESASPVDEQVQQAYSYFYHGQYTKSVRMIGQGNLDHPDYNVTVSMLNIFVLICLQDWKNARKMYHNLSTQIDAFSIYHEVIGLFLIIPTHSSRYILKQLSLLQEESAHILIQWCRINVLIYNKKISCKEAERKLRSIEWEPELMPYIHLSIEFFTYQKKYHHALIFISILLELQENNVYLYYLRAWNYYQLGLIKPALNTLKTVLTLDRGYIRGNNLLARIENRSFLESIYYLLKKILIFRS